MPRPTLYTPQVAEMILSSLRIGCTKKASALASGIAERTFYEWQSDNQAFREAVEEAEGHAEHTFTATLERAASGKILRWERITENKDGSTTIEREYLPQDWKAAESWLRRRRKSEWNDGLLDVRKLTDEQLLKMLVAENEPGRSQHEE